MVSVMAQNTTSLWRTPFIAERKTSALQMRVQLCTASFHSAQASMHRVLRMYTRIGTYLPSAWNSEPCEMPSLERSWSSRMNPECFSIQGMSVEEGFSADFDSGAIAGLASTPIPIRIPIENTFDKKLDPRQAIHKEEGLLHFRDTLHYDLYRALARVGDKNAMLSCRDARDWARWSVGGDDQRVRTLTNKLPPQLR